MLPCSMMIFPRRKRSRDDKAVRGGKSPTTLERLHLTETRECNSSFTRVPDGDWHGHEELGLGPCLRNGETGRATLGIIPLTGERRGSFTSVTEGEECCSMWRLQQQEHGKSCFVQPDRPDVEKKLQTRLFPPEQRRAATPTAPSLSFNQA